MGRFSSSRVRFRGLQQRGFRPTLGPLVLLLGFAYLLVVLPFFFTVIERKRAGATPSASGNPFRFSELPEVPTFDPSDTKGPWYDLEKHDAGYDILHRELPGVREGSALTGNLPVGRQGESESAQGVVSTVAIDWFSECGCTGIEIESANICARLLPSFPGLRLNSCPNRCTQPFPRLAAALRQLTAPRAESARLVVVHIAYEGVCGLPRELQQYYELAGRSVPVGSKRPYLVSRTMAEEDRIDDEAVRRCDGSFDEVWVPSHHTRTAFLRSGVRPTTLFRVPETIDFEAFSRKAVTAPLRLFPKHPAVDFVFLSIFKWEERKNWPLLLSAFCDTFRNNSRVGLYIKTSAYQGVHPALEASEHLRSMDEEPPEGTSGKKQAQILAESDHRRRLAGVEELRMEQDRTDLKRCGAPIALDESPLPMDKMPALYAGADAFVLPTHGEGWGLPFMEAMAMELPTIGTAWGGNMDFMTHNNSWLVPVAKMVFGGSSMDGRWAEPDGAVLRAHLAMVYAARGSQAQRARTDAARAGLLRAFGGVAGMHAARTRLQSVVEKAPHLFTFTPKPFTFPKFLYPNRNLPI